MEKHGEYRYEVFLSWTGGDKPLKNKIKTALSDAGVSSDVVFDSDEHCCGDFTENCAAAVNSCKVFVLILTDNLLKNPQSLCRTELNLAVDCETKNKLNIQVFSTTRGVLPDSHYEDYEVGSLEQFYFVHTRGRNFVYAADAYENRPVDNVDEEYNSYVDCAADSEETVSAVSGLDSKINELVRKIGALIEYRNTGTPVVFSPPDFGIKESSVPVYDYNGERKSEIEKIDNFFQENGKKFVVLQGERGMGKSRCAMEYANYIAKAYGFKVTHVEMSGSEWERFFADIPLTDDAVDKLNKRTQGLSERERKIARKEDILSYISSLPKYWLVHINKVRSFGPAFYECLCKKGFKCRVLITTDSPCLLKKENVGEVNIGPFPQTVAKKMFDAKVGSVSDEGQFSSLYSMLSGNTLALGLVASTLRNHANTLSLARILGNNSDIRQTADAAINFDYKGEEKTDTLANHLLRLFRMAELTSEEEELLCNMCLLRDDRTDVGAIVSMMSYHNENVVNSLCDKGILSKSADGKIELHSLFRVLVTLQMRLTRDRTSRAIAYLLSRSDVGEGGVTYREASESADEIWYAIDKIASSGGEFCIDLFDRYRFLVEYRGDGFDEINKKCRKLRNMLGDNLAPDQLAALKCFTDETEIKTLTLSGENLARAMGILEENSEKIATAEERYKWVARTLERVLRVVDLTDPQYKSKVYAIVDRALSLAIGNNDDIAVYYFASICCAYGIFSSNIGKKIRKYLRRRREESGVNGFNLLTQYQLSVGRSGVGRVVDMAKDLVSANAHDSTLSLAKILLSHLPEAISATKFAYKLKKLDEDDALGSFYSNLKRIADTYVDEGVVDVESFCATEEIIWNRVRESGLSNVSKQEAFLNIVRTLNNFFPEATLGSANTYLTARLLQHGKGDSLDALRWMLSIGEAARMLGGQIADKDLDEYIGMAENSMPLGHPDLLRAEMLRANYYALNSRSKEQFASLLRIFHNMQVESCGVDFVHDVCYAIAAHSDSVKMSQQLLADLCEKEVASTDIARQAEFFAQVVCQRNVRRLPPASGSPMVEHLLRISTAYAEGNLRKNATELLWALGHVCTTESEYEDVKASLLALRKTYKKTARLKSIANAMLVHAKLTREKCALAEKKVGLLKEMPSSGTSPYANSDSVEKLVLEARETVRGFCRYLCRVLRDRLVFGGKYEVHYTIYNIVNVWQGCVAAYDSSYFGLSSDPAVFVDALFDWVGGRKFFARLVQRYGHDKLVCVDVEAATSDFLADREASKGVVRKGNAGWLLYRIYEYALEGAVSE